MGQKPPERNSPPASSLVFQEPSAGTGEVLLSVSYLPAANRLLVVLIKARSLHSNQPKDLLGKGECTVRGESQGPLASGNVCRGRWHLGGNGDRKQWSMSTFVESASALSSPQAHKLILKDTHFFKFTSI